jgi:CubicO group peptidase (beta-lactamase class C family)
MLYSLSKSFTSTAVGMAINEGYLSVDDLVVSFFPEETAGNTDPNLAKMRVRHLLSMSTGHAEDTTAHRDELFDTKWCAGILTIPVEYEPGTHFVYNSGASYLLSAIIQKLTGMKIVDYLQPRLFEPLGIEHPTWEISPEGINSGGWGLNLKTEDIARFGQLYLQKGVWEGRQLLPESWVKAATSVQISNGNNPDSDWEQGYGYQFWRCRHGAYRGDGAFGQFCIIMPEQDAVLAITSAVDDLQPILNEVWEHILPFLGTEPLPEDPANQAKLTQKLSGLALMPPQGQVMGNSAASLSGQTFRMEPNDLKIEAISFDFKADQSTITLHTTQGKRTIVCGNGAWIDGIVEAGEELGPQPAVCSGIWSADNTFEATFRYYETPFFDTFAFHFDKDRLTIQGSVNVSFGAKEHPLLKGQSV